jgi:hypothetical protein
MAHYTGSIPLKQGYTAIDQWFKERKLTWNSRPDPEVANRTWIRPDCLNDMTVYVMHYINTDIMTWYPDGNIALDTHGWLTMTTKERLNWGMPKHWGISQDHKLWYLRHWKEFHEPADPTTTWDHQPYRNTWKDVGSWVYADGMIFNPETGVITGAGEDQKALVRKLKLYVRKYMEALSTGQVQAPGPGDCLYCAALRDTEDLTTEFGRQYAKEHMLLHIDENYFVPSLLNNAVKEHANKVSPVALWYLGSFWNPGEFAGLKLDGDKFHARQLGGALQTYLGRRLGVPI